MMVALVWLLGCANDAPVGWAPGVVRVRAADGGGAIPRIRDASPRDAEGPPAVADDAGALAPVGSFVRILSPVAGERFARDERAGVDWIARVELEVAHAGVSALALDVAGVRRVESAAASPVALVAQLRSDGAHALEVRGLDARGDAVTAPVRVSVRIGPPAEEGCRAALRAEGISWDEAAPRRGIPDPVVLEPVLRGVAFRGLRQGMPRPLLVDCDLAPRLVALAGILRRLGMVEATHLGVYNYRCIGGGDPDDDMCRPSQHAFARAIDLYGFRTEEGDELLLERDWIIDEGPTCEGIRSDPGDRLLHDLACAMHEEGVFEIVLTPNYNAAHRNHFHVDITEGRRFLGRSIAGVDPPVPGLGHAAN